MCFNLWLFLSPCAAHDDALFSSSQEQGSTGYPGSGCAELAVPIFSLLTIQSLSPTASLQSVYCNFPSKHPMEKTTERFCEVGLG